MAEDKKSFLLYADYIKFVRKMPDDKAGVLFKTILSYVNDENPVIEDMVVDLVFEQIKSNLKRDLEKWDKILIMRSEKGRAGGLASAEARRSKTNQVEPKSTTGSTGQPNQAVNVTVTVNDNVINKKGIAEFLLFESAKEADPVFYDFVDSYKKILLETFPKDFMNIQVIPLMDFSAIAREMIESYGIKDIKRVLKNAGQSTFWKPQLYNLAAINKNFMAIKNIEIVKTGKSEEKPVYKAPAKIDFKTLE